MATAASVPFNEHLRISDAIADGASAAAGQFHCRWRPEYANSSGNYHGGVLMAMADAAMSRALQARLAPGLRAATVQMSSSFLAAGGSDVSITVHTEKLGKRIAHCRVSIATTSGKLLFTATAAFAVTAAAPSPQ